MMQTRKLTSAELLTVLLLPLTFLAFMLLALPIYSDMSRFYAWLLFVVGCFPMFSYLKRPVGAPVIELVLLNYVLFFSLPVFHEESLSIYIGEFIPPKESIELTLICALAGIITLQIGYRIAGNILSSLNLPRIHLNCSSDKLFKFAVVSVLISLLMSAIGGRIPQDLIRLLQVLISADLGVSLLSVLYYQKLLNVVQRKIAVFFLILIVLAGIATGMTQAALQPILIWFLCRWFVTGTIPWKLFFTLLILFLLMQPVKMEYRNRVWFGGEAPSAPAKVMLYGKIFIDHWFSGSGSLVDRSAESTSRRLSLLQQTAHVLNWTPSVVPYRNGATLSYLIYTWIPRFLWVNKPIAQQANIDFALSYGIQHPRTINSARFGIGHLGEAYINFGIAGVLLIFLCLGFLYEAPLQLLSDMKESPAGLAILAAIIINFVFIGSTIGNVFGSIIQQVFVQSLLLKIFTKRAAK